MTRKLKSIDLFAGAGGFSISIEQSNINNIASIDNDQKTINTLKLNANHPSPWHNNTSIIKKNLKEEPLAIDEQLDLITAGPPCQPFSAAGIALSQFDSRDCFPSTIKIIQSLTPSAFIIENVPGLTRRKFNSYYTHILNRLSNGGKINNRPNQFALFSHDVNTPTYNLYTKIVNSADFGVPQIRKRLFIVGIHADINFDYMFPQPTHSKEALVHSQMTGDYWMRYNIKPTNTVNNNQHEFKNTENKSPWLTVRDVIHRPPPADFDLNSGIENNTTPKTYKGHSGSDIDWPAKTIKAGVNGVPGGENMINYKNGYLRYFSVREAARIQSFPDDYYFAGSWSECMRQIGNAVPVALGQHMIKSVKDILTN